MWLEAFLEQVIKHLLRTKSDRTPIVVMASKQERHHRVVSFKMLSTWYHHPQFLELVQALWEEPSSSLLGKMDRFRVVASQWNRHSFGNIFWRKKTLLARLGGIQKRLSIRHSHFLSNLELELREELNTMLQQKEHLWKQKSQVNWLKCGEHNTKYFHVTTVIRRWRGRVHLLKEENGDW